VQHSPVVYTTELTFSLLIDLSSAKFPKFLGRGHGHTAVPSTGRVAAAVD